MRGWVGVWFYLPAFEVQRECLEGPAAPVAAASRVPPERLDLQKETYHHHQHHHTPNRLLAFSFFFRSGSDQGYYSLATPCLGVSTLFLLLLDMCKTSSNLDNQTDYLFLHPPKRDVQADRVVLKCTRDLGNQASSSVNELKIPD